MYLKNIVELEKIVNPESLGDEVAAVKIWKLSVDNQHLSAHFMGNDLEGGNLLRGLLHKHFFPILSSFFFQLEHPVVVKRHRFSRKSIIQYSSVTPRVFHAQNSPPQPGYRHTKIVRLLQKAVLIRPFHKPTQYYRRGYSRQRPDF